MHKKKKFIDTKNERTATFSVIHRSQRDPLAADEEAPQRLLQVIRESDGCIDGPPESGKKIKLQKEEEREFGVFYNDDYDYLQHLKDRDAPEYDWSEMDRFLIEKTNEDNSNSAKEELVTKCQSKMQLDKLKGKVSQECNLTCRECNPR